MQYRDKSPRTDDFRLERSDGNIVITFTPDGRSYTFRIESDRLSEPSVSPAQAKAADYEDDEIRKTAIDLARLALRGSRGG